MTNMRFPGANNSTLHALFPTMVYQNHLSDHAEINTLFQSALSEHGFQPEAPSSGQHFAGEYHGQILLHQDPCLKPFFQTLSEHVAEYLKALGIKPGFFELRFLKSWFVLCEPGGENNHALMTHNHSCSDISWVYYVDVPKDGPAIQFHIGKTPASAPFESAFHYDWSNEQKSAINTINWWNADSWSIHPGTGDLLLFPGHQLHSVESNHCDTTRISVAGDIALVLKKEFRNLEFGRTHPQHWLSMPLPDSDSASDSDA